MLNCLKPFAYLLIGLAFSATLMSSGPPVSLSKTSANSTTKEYKNFETRSLANYFAGIDGAFLLPDNTFKPDIKFMGFVIMDDAKPDNTIINGILHEQERQKQDMSILI